MVWGAFCGNGRSRLLVISDNLNAAAYRNQVLAQEAVLFMAAHALKCICWFEFNQVKTFAIDELPVGFVCSSYGQLMVNPSNLALRVHAVDWCHVLLVIGLMPDNITFTNTYRKNTTVMWDQASDFDGLSGYKISWSPDDGTKNEASSQRSSNITNLNPGVTYTVTVTAIIDANSGNKQIGASAKVTTIQTLTGSCLAPVLCGRQHYFAECVGGACRCIYKKYRNSDGNCHEVDELIPTSFNVSKVLSWSAEFAWTVSEYVTQAPNSTIQYSVTVSLNAQLISTSDTSTVNGLTAGQSYSATIVTTLQQDGKQQIITSTEKASFSTNKIGNNMTCKSGDGCSDGNAYCNITDPERCRCNQGYFWSGNPLLCKPGTST
ncbi:uncharacterized protein LOC121391202 [Gigantopelta aegis]|uniref:uncharacterized protein LOC121391202 n=1 Tax=Gigantopelta aegis TaxID=1735272 RepID=UPI001B88DA44|nr:uncharacterized protein LOC121391202 [Gigantopelta aegis]